MERGGAWKVYGKGSNRLLRWLKLAIKKFLQSCIKGKKEGSLRVKTGRGGGERVKTGRGGGERVKKKR